MASEAGSITNNEMDDSDTAALCNAIGCVLGAAEYAQPGKRASTLAIRWRLMHGQN